jgi:general stress protein YciG
MNLRKGFAAMSPDKQREIASKGGKRAHEVGTAHEFTPDEARRAGSLGGQAVV